MEENPRARSAKLRVGSPPSSQGPRRAPATRERALTRTKVQAREAGQASVFAVIGFLAVGVFAALLLQLCPVRGGQ